MDTEDFVTYEQALALKKLGFDWDVNYVYYPNKSIGEVFPKGNYNNMSAEFITCSAPTLAQAQKWLRKEKDYHIEPRLFYDKFHTDCKSSSRGKYWQIEHGKYYFSYEEALSAGITECIKLLEKED